MADKEKIWSEDLSELESGSTEWDDVEDKPDYLERIATDAVMWMKGDGTTVGDIKVIVVGGVLQYLELDTLPSTWTEATIQDINLASHGSLNTRLESMENAREFVGGFDPTGDMTQLDDAFNGAWWLLTTDGTISGESFEANDMLICHTEVVGTPANLDNFAHIESTVNAMVGATSTVDGVSGSAPTPSAGDNDKVLSGAGLWIDLGLTAMQENVDTNTNAVAALDNTQIVSTDGDTLIKVSDSYIKTALNNKNIGYATGTYYKLRSPDMTTQLNLTDGKSPSVSTDSGSTWIDIATTEDITSVEDRLDVIEEVKCKLVSGTVDISSSGSTYISTGIARDKVVSYSLLLQRTTLDYQWWDGTDTDDSLAFNHYYHYSKIGIEDAGAWYTGGNTEYRVVVWYTE